MNGTDNAGFVFRNRQAMDQSSESREHPRVDLFPLWDERDIHRVWLFHKDEPKVIFGLLQNISLSGGCLIMHKPDVLPEKFRLGLLDQHGNTLLVLEMHATEQWQQPYFAGFKKVGFRCERLCNSMSEQFDAMAQRLASGEIEYLRSRIERL